MWVVSFSNQLSFPSQGAAPVLMSTLWRLQAHSLMFLQSLQGQRSNYNQAGGGKIQRNLGLPEVFRTAQ